VSRREDIDNSIWSDPDFHGLSPHAKLVYLWSFTNPRCGMAGLYKVVLGALALETGLSGADVSAALEELRQERFVLYDKGVLWVRSRVKHLRTKTPMIARSIARDVESISGPLRDQFVAEYRSLGWLADPLGTLSSTSTEGLEKDGGNAESGDPLQTHSRGSRDPQGQGMGKGSSEEDAASRADARAADNRLDDAKDRLRKREFTDWLDDHQAVTGHNPPREGTKAREALVAAFGARRQEGYDLDELKLATRGGHADDYRRENGYDNAESVLRPTKIHNLIERGRRAGEPGRPSFGTVIASAERREREMEKRRRERTTA
jgi:hypothetical protein